MNEVFFEIDEIKERTYSPQSVEFDCNRGEACRVVKLKFV